MPATITDPEMLKYIRLVHEHYPPDPNKLSADEDRRHYDKLCAVFQGNRPDDIAVEDVKINARSPDRELAIRHYRAGQPQTGSKSVLLYLHGGGFIVGGLESHDSICAEICADSGLEVVALDYRLAPDHLFPAALDDAQEAYLHLLKDGRSVVVGGDSAGGCLAVGVCLRARRMGFAMPLGQLLIYPGLGGDPDKGSYIEHAEAPMLTRTDCLHYFQVYSGGQLRGLANNPELSPLVAETFAGLPPASIFSADVDPLRDDASEYANRLRKDGVAVRYRNEEQLVHGYLRARRTSRRAAKSFASICDSLSWLTGLDCRDPAGPDSG